MEKIDLNNYEAYFLDLMEGTLSAEEKHDLFAFLELHPELKAEMEEDFGLFADQVHSESGKLFSYRGKNANMYACEALIAAFEATQDNLFLQQALCIANTIVNQQTASTNGLLWEHYNDDWQVDWTYNQHHPQNLYKPWGYQTGHFTEWAKLLLILHSYKPQIWMLDKAKFLVDTAWQSGWGKTRGGLYYGFDLQGSVCDDHKYFWVQAETLPALAMLSKHYPDGPYLNYLKLIIKIRSSCKRK